MAYHVDADPRQHSEKTSPLINEIANRTRVPGAPSTQRLSGSGRDGGSPVPPAAAVDLDEHMHVHRHDGAAENVRPYFHNHPHDHPVSHDPDDPNDTVDHDRRDHLRDARHQAALRGFGGWEAKSAGPGPADAIKAIQADSERMQGYVYNRDISLSMINERLAANAAASRQLSMSAELTDLRKGAGATHTKRATAARPSVAKRDNPMLAEVQKGLDPVLKLAEEREALRPYLTHPDFQIRAGAKELMDQKLAEIEKYGRPDIQKVAQAEYVPSSELSKAIQAAVTKALGNLGERIDALNARAPRQS